jgi:tRNA(Ile)-lysidine synthetase-like protein
VIEFRRGGETQAGAEPPTRPVKYHYQALNIPAWERGRLPVVKNANHLLFAAGIGMDCQHVAAELGAFACAGKLYRHRGAFCRILYVDMSIRYDL